MSLRNENGQIAIDDEIAARDVKKISDARAILQECLHTVDTILVQAEEMTGKTSQSVTNKGYELKKKMEELIDNLEESEDYINQTVNRYIEIDRIYAQTVQNETAGQ